MITSSSNSRVKQVLQWRTKAKERRKDKVFLVEGWKMYEEAPGKLIRDVYLSEGFLGRLSQRFGADSDIVQKLGRTGYEEVSEEVFRKMSDTQTPQGILAVLGQPQYSLQDLICKADGNGRKFLFLLLENLQDPGNLGTIIRTAEGVGITAVIMSADTVDIFNPKVIRSTMGSIYRVPFVYEESLVETVGYLHSCGVKTYAAHLQGKEYYDSFSFREHTAFLIGNEGNGLTPELSGAASAFLKIPMEGRLESLNASVAASLLMYEAYRQRRNCVLGEGV